MAINHDLQKKISSLDEFRNLTVRLLNNIGEMTELEFEKNGYEILKSTINADGRYCRPCNSNLFIKDSNEFIAKYDEFMNILLKVSERRTNISQEDYDVIDQVTYTMQQSLGIGMDLYIDPNAARKHVGNRFEELIGLIVSEIGLSNKKVVLRIPYDNGKIYGCETDMVFTNGQEVLSDSGHIDDDEIVVSLKTSSKDRMGKIFIDKLLMNKFCQKEVKVLGIFLNDVQRKGSDSINYTFVSGLFMVYTNFLTRLDGVYFIDPPPHYLEEPFSNHIFRFSKFIIEDAYSFFD